MAASGLLGKEGEWAQLWELLRESGTTKAQDLDQILVEETWYCGVASSVSRRESAWDLRGAMYA